MSKRFIKLIDSEASQWLQEEFPWAFLLLTHIARRSRRTIDSTDGLEIGECHIGDYKKAGLPSEKIYRTAKERLVLEGFILIVETCRKRGKAETGRPIVKKRATERATYGTLVRLISSSIYDINAEIEGDRNGDRNLKTGRPKGDEQECKNVNTKEKQQQVVVVFSCLSVFSESILSNSEKQKISSKYDEPIVKDAVAAITQQGFTPKDTVAIALQAACKGKWKPKPPMSDNVEANRREALKLKDEYKGLYTIEPLSKHLEIIKGGNSEPLVFFYEIPHEAFKNNISKFYQHTK